MRINVMRTFFNSISILLEWLLLSHYFFRKLDDIFEKINS